MREYRFVRDAKPVDGLVGMNMGTVNWRHEEKPTRSMPRA